MKINVYQIAKSNEKSVELMIKEFIKMSSRYAKVDVHNVFNKRIAKAQMLSEIESQKAYTEVFEPYLDNGFNIALDVLGDQMDSFEFSKLFENHATVNFFIGGAFGFERDFLHKCDKNISLSTLTMAHKIANIVLLEQVFRGLCIINNHPYHK
jgi:23S rRNA (pseudouridine1915-N3)-methyltransferase